MECQPPTHQSTKDTKARVPEFRVHVTPEGGGGGPYEGVGGHAEAQRCAGGSRGNYLGHGTANDDIDEGAGHHHGNHDDAQEGQRVGKTLLRNGGQKIKKSKFGRGEEEERPTSRK